ncbi:MAG TPA: C2HC-type zinc finger protein, partial [Ktedonobacteraceae bacterium]|nr:C2HC-type zinc finger protein [Ktedonobacteraceae bacterium]
MAEQVMGVEEDSQVQVQRPISPWSSSKRKYLLHMSRGKAQSATYATVKDTIIQYIQKTFKDGFDVAQSLKDGAVYDLAKHEPEREISTLTDQPNAQLEQSGFDIKYQEELRRFLDRKDNLRQGLVKAYALIFSNYCNRTMQSRIEEHPEFESKIEGNPIALLEAIKTLMHDPVRAQYPLVSMTDALTRLINVKQMENEPLLDYVKRFKQLRDVAKSHLGTKVLDQFIEQSEEYRTATTTESKNKLKEDAFSAWMAYLLIKGSDQSKYGSITKGFVSQYSLGNDQYPKTIQMATDVLSNHKLDAKYYESQKRNRSRNEQQQQQQQESDAPPATSFPQRGVVCYVCGKPGHTKPECPNLAKIP